MRPIFMAVAGVSLVTALTVAQSPPAPAPTTPVELDVVVLDKQDRPVRGLQQADFRVKDDDRAVTLTSFREVSAAGIDGPADGRTVSILLDDNSVALSATLIMRAIAQHFLAYARPADSVSVVRLTHREDEAAGGLPAALERIDEYHTGSLSFFGRDMRDDMLQTVTRVSRQLEPMAHRRKVLICIGSRGVCDPYFDYPRNSLIWNSWRDAIIAAARANTTVYFVSPAGIEGRIDLGDGLVENTGGGEFIRSNDFDRDARMIWDEAGHYYLLGYTPSGRSRDLHTIGVRVARPGLHVRARLGRGD